MDCSVHPNAMVSFDFSSLSTIHKSVQRNSRTPKRKIRMDINKNALQSYFENDFSGANNEPGPSYQPESSMSGPNFQGFSTQSHVSREPLIQLQDLLPTPDYRVISPQSEAGVSGMATNKAKLKGLSTHIRIVSLGKSKMMQISLLSLFWQ